MTFNTDSRVDRRRPRSRKLSGRAVVHAIDGQERPYPGYHFSGRQFFTRPNHNAFAGGDYVVISITPTIPSPVLNQPYTYQLEQEGGVEPITWALTSGILPVGLTVSASGLISGTPTETGLQSFVMSATDSSATPVTTARSLAIQVNRQVPG